MSANSVVSYLRQNQNRFDFSCRKIENALRGCRKPIKVAVMGCVVNGPGEAKEADIGVAGGDGCGMIFKHGEILKK